MRDREIRVAGAPPEGEALPEKRAYGCLFCITGKEKVVAEELECVCPGIRAIAARQEKHKSVKGRKMKTEAVFLPSYVFFEAPWSFQPVEAFPHDNIIRVLTVERGIWQLSGEDEHFARWLFSYNGLLEFSKAYREGSKVRIASGPLKDMEGRIQRIDKRGRSGQVVLEFNGKTMPVWLGFDLLDTISLR